MGEESGKYFIILIKILSSRELDQEKSLNSWKKSRNTW
jgi:hypothetical protein